MLTNLSSKLLAVSAAAAILISWLLPSFRQNCFLPSAAADSSQADRQVHTGLTIIEADEVEFGFLFFEWIEELFGL